MKKLLFLLALLVLPIPAFSQAIQITTGLTVSAATQGDGLATPTTYFHQITWGTVGNPGTCTVKVDGSDDNNSWGDGDIISARSCTSPGSSAITNVIKNYIRINVSVFSGPGSVRVSYTGYASSGGSTGGLSGLTAGGVMYATSPIAAAANSTFTWDNTTKTLSIGGSSSGLIGIKGAAAAGTWTLTLPANDGDNLQFLQTNGSGVTSWADFTGANAALSNLASVAINTTLVSDTNNTDDLGSSGVKWRTGYFATSLNLGSLTLTGFYQAQDCGTTGTCAATNISSTLKIVKGSVALSTGTPSTAAVTGFSPAFSSSSSFVCNVSNATSATGNLLKVVNDSSSAITITGPATVTDVVNYICVGN